MKAWVYQDDKQVKKHGGKKASWYVGWIDPEGHKRCQSCGPGSAGKNAAEKLQRKRQAELITGTYQDNSKKTWAQFRQEYTLKILAGTDPSTRRLIDGALDHFEEVISPKRLATIRTQTIDTYVAKRRTERGKKVGSLVAKATINKELRHLRAALRKAHKWGWLPKLPDFAFEKEPKKLPTYIPPEHFAKIYQACEGAKLPADQPYSAADWWRALMVMGYMTGWRISDMLGLLRDDLDLDAGTAITRFEDNKGKRDEKVKLHPVVLEHLRKLPGFTPTVFPWHESTTALYVEFARIQEAAGIHLHCHGKHEHTRFCYVYGFHDLRRAFATMNADKLTADALQALMRHKSYTTTQKYINMARQMDEAVASLHVPEVLNKAKG